MNTLINLCQCGCGEFCKNKYVYKHNRRGKKDSPETKERKRLGALSHPSNLRNAIHTPESYKITHDKHRGQKRTIEQKKRYSLATTERWNSGVYDNNSWLRGESSLEKIFREFLEGMGEIKNKNFFQEYQVGRYRIDFAYISEDRKVGFELDGPQHLRLENIKHDKKRDKLLIEQGWTIYRMTAKKLKEFIQLF